MGWRWHLYKFNKKELKQLKTKNFSKFENVLCAERTISWNVIYTRAKSLKVPHISDYNATPVVISKSLLHELIEAVFEQFQQYILSTLFYTEDATRPMQVGNLDLSERLLYPTQNDKMLRNHYGEAELASYCTRYCELSSKAKFMDLLDNKDKLVEPDSIFQILMQLVYVYKTYSEKETLVLVGW